MIKTEVVNPVVADHFRAVRSGLSDLDLWLGSLVRLQSPSYTNDPNLVGLGDGVFTAADWTATRRKGAKIFGTDGSQYDSNEKYLKHIFGAESANVVAAVSLAKSFDFGRYRSIFEIGCGDMAQAFIISRLFPNVRYVATDLDSYVIGRCASLTLLDGIEKRVVDINSENEEWLPGDVDLLTSWGVDYALSDHQLVSLLRLIGNRKIPYLMCSATAVGPVKHLMRQFARRQIARKAKAGRLRTQGWNRSLRQFRLLGHKAGVRMYSLGRFGYFFTSLFVPK